MKKITFLLLVCLYMSLPINSQNNYLKHLSSYLSKGDGSAETVAFNSSETIPKAFLTNSNANSFSIVNLTDLSNPTLIKEVSLASYGAGPNSITTYGDLVAVAVEATVKQDNGKVVFFNLDGVFVKEITVGALPDMLTFTPNGKKLLVANEGEPSKDYMNDPEGSISIIELSTGINNATVSTITFESYNNKKYALLNKGVRIFGKDATVAQDLEPEYITVIEDGSMAYVVCQENNALLVIDLTNNTLKDIMPLGFKDHSKGTPSVKSYVLNELVANWPELGTPVYDGGQPAVQLGGFSGLYYDEVNSTDENMVFFAVPDRGPNTASVKKDKFTPNTTQNVRPFKLPNYQGRIVKFTVNKNSGTVTLDNQILLTRKDGTTPITGKGNIPGHDEIPVTYSDANTIYNKVDYTDDSGETYHALSYDEFGGDFEGILIDKNGKFWMCDEYRPALYQFEANGTLIERYVPAGTSNLGTTVQPVGTYGAETLPKVYSKRRANRGFEAIAYDKEADIIYAFIQTPMYNPDSSTKNQSDVIRILGVNAANGTPVSEYVYVLERNRDAGFAHSRVDKIGDAVYAGNGKFYVLERDSSNPEDVGGKKYVYSIDINYATNTLGKNYTKQLEEFTTDELIAEGITPVVKHKVTNLPSIGYVSSDKPEGLALLPEGKLAVLNDNDFGVAGAGITDKSALGIISFANDYGFDASNKDDKINIQNQPTLGMYQPDAIASYTVNGMDYIVTANEGDARDYDGYSEETRVKDVTLNSSVYPNASTLQQNENLGRLKTTTATGDYNNDGTIDQIYSYGARSFSIFDKYGNLVYDSADLFGQTVKEEEPDLFNQDEGEKDNRSDDKGVEPEAVAIGKINDKVFAFIGLERQNSIIVFDITNPKEVKFVTYYKDNIAKGDVAPEIIKFVGAANSPNGKNILLVGYEVSGTMAVIELDEKALDIKEFETEKASFTVYPVPTHTTLNFNERISAKIYSINGKVVKEFENKNQVDVSKLPTGVYIVKTKEKGTKRFLKM
ncbi:conserved protein of unknown function precursor containing a type A C-terminal secretion signal [Tenacibaculum sp. 190524A02b]|uniref:choice-of-anchor I domain-containing protein n=1 Tax=Tenacibaculum vairaonense TaxID=3137860 RepID=UPI0032B13169